MRTALQGTWPRAASLGLVIGVGLILAATVGVPSVDAVRSTVDAAGAAGWAVLVVGTALLLLAPVPRSALSVVVGVLLGFGGGLAVAFAGGLLGAVGAFALSRTLGRETVQRLAGPRLVRFDALMTGRPFVSVLLGRLMPVLPFFALSYGAGLLGIRFAPYFAATAVGLLPSTTVQVGIGASVGFVVSGGSMLALLPAVAGALALTAIAAITWRRRRRSTEPPEVESASLAVR
jgi:uncharacterized membrane protein YdjX (TVP38/TMEM64 family)